MLCVSLVGVSGDLFCFTAFMSTCVKTRRIRRIMGTACEKLSGFEAYLDPKEPTFLGFLIMNSLL